MSDRKNDNIVLIKQINNMTKVQEMLAALPDEKKACFVPVFGSVERFYTIVYLIAKNEHLTEQEKPDRYEDRLQVIRQIRRKVEQLVDSFGLPGEDTVADIASDYFEDYVQYREPEFGITNEDFVDVIRKISQLA